MGDLKNKQKNPKQTKKRLSWTK